MDDPIFDPWGVEAASAGAVGPRTAATPQPPASTPPSRWRSTGGALRARPGSASVQRARLPGTAGFLRTLAVPRLLDAALRLEMARHTATVEDLLDAAPPSLRLLLRPWRGPWTEELSAPLGVLELVLADGPGGPVTVRTWLDAESAEPTDEMEVPPSRVGAAWLDQAVVAFVKARLTRI